MNFDELLRLINFCETIQKEGTDPFDLDVKKSLKSLKQFLQKWKSLDDLLLDAETISEISKIIELQGKWIRDRSSSFYVDPILMELKIKMLEPNQLANVFFKSWHPIISMDSITPERLKEGINYWNALLPFGERKEEFPLPSPAETFKFSIEELIDLKILSKSEFNESIKKVLKDLQEKGRIEYHDFIYEEEFEDSITKAYLISYLVNEGKAELDIDPLEEKAFLSPIEAIHTQGEAKSIPISIDYQDWLRWKKNQRRKGR